MKDLGSLLINEIKNNGPMPLSSYIQQCLLHPTFGYYSKKTVFGVDGDFTTAPEISQMFGELIALSILQTWIDQGSPSQIILTELGPGRGTMMADMLRTFKSYPKFLKAAEIHLVEASSNLKHLQKTRLSEYNIVWHEKLPKFENKHLFLIANEFFDALPIEQYLRKGDNFFKRTVQVSDGKLKFGLE